MPPRPVPAVVIPLALSVFWRQLCRVSITAATHGSEAEFVSVLSQGYEVKDILRIYIQTSSFQKPLRQDSHAGNID